MRTPFCNEHFDEDAESRPSVDLLDDAAFAQALARRCDTLRVEAILEMDPSRYPLRLWPGDAIEASLLHGPMLRVCFHEWHGSRLVCTELTSPLVLPNRPCPVCAAKRNPTTEIWADDFRVHTWTRFYIPCAAEAKRLPDGTWQRWKTRFAVLLEVDEDFAWTWQVSEFAFGRTYRISRRESLTRRWVWDVEVVAEAVPLTEHELRSLRTGMPGVLVLDPRDEDVAGFVKMAQANWLNAPLPGRAQVLQDALPGVLLLPCYYATKRTRVRWSGGFWSHQNMEEYGMARLDKGNIAVLLGAPSDGLCSIDWDTDEYDVEFRRRNLWARSCMRSWGSRPPGNYWFRIRDLPKAVAHVHKLACGDEKVGEIRLGHGITVLSGAHPSGAEYRIEHLGVVPEITLDQITWPGGVRAVQAASATSRDFAAQMN
jgi:hypothetical protein